jgi:signal transduction histidine kinase
MRDKDQADKIIFNEIKNNVNVIDIFNIIHHSQYLIGKLWEENRISISDEHYATQISLDLINTVVQDSYQIKSNSNENIGTALLLVVEGEYHYVGLKMFATLLSKMGWNVEFLGQSLPTSDLNAVLSKSSKKYDLICISITMFENLLVLMKTLKIIRGKDVLKDSVVIIGGSLFEYQKIRDFVLDQYKHAPLVDYIALDISDALRFISSSQKLSAKTIVDLKKMLIIEQSKYRHLKEIEKLKEEFVSMVTHEMKSPVTTILLYSEMMLKEKKGELNKYYKKAIHTIRRNAINLESLISDSLDAYKLDLGKITISKGIVDIKSLIDDMTTNIIPLTAYKGVKLVTDIQVQHPVYFDKKRIEQVLVNLVKNAVDFVPSDGGTILVFVKDVENIINDNDKLIPLELKETIHFNNKDNGTVKHSVLFGVKDNGIGISENETDKLFTKFYQIDHKVNRSYGGSGLGLSICKGIVEAHGGVIGAINNQDGNGATFYFILPDADK